MRDQMEAGGGCLAAMLGTVGALALWMPRGRAKVHGGFEGEGQDLTVLVTEMPLVALAGGLLFLVLYALVLRALRGSREPGSREPGSREPGSQGGST